MKNPKLTIALVVFILGLLPKSWADFPTPAQLEDLSARDPGITTTILPPSPTL